MSGTGSIQSLDLSNNKIDSQCINVLEPIVCDTNISVLNLAANPICNEGVKKLSEYLLSEKQQQIKLT